MLELRKIAITGRLCAGKSTSCSLLKELGGFVISADELVHDLLISDDPCIQKITDLLGQEIKINGQIDRKKVADLVFFNKEKLLALEKILHPLVLQKIKHLYKDACKQKDYKFFIVEVPLLFESKSESFFDTVIVVTSPESFCRSQAQKKGLSSIGYDARVQRLLPIEETIKRADFVINNNGSISNLKEKLKEILQKLKL